MKSVLIAIALVIVAASVVVGNQPQSADWAPETTPAYAVLVLRKAAIESELGYLSRTVTNRHPSVDTKRFELQAITIEMNKMRSVDKSRVSRLSSTLGDLILSKVALEVELNDLLAHLTSQHPDVQKKGLELAALQREIEHILQ